MITKIFAIYDQKAEAYLQPFFMATRGLAIRAIQDAAKDPKSQFSQHPQDFTLYEIGVFSDVHGAISEPEGGLQRIIAFSDLSSNVEVESN